MLKFLIGVLTGIVFAVVLAVIVFATLAFAVGRKGDKPVTVADNSVLVVRLEGDIPERAARRLQQYSLLSIQGARSPSKMCGLRSIRLPPIRTSKPFSSSLRGHPSVGANCRRIKADLDQFKKSGKPIYAYLTAPNARDYYLSSSANKIYIEPESLLDLKGMRFELMYFKRTLDKVGVTVDVEHAGKYKDFGDMFTRSNASPETKEVLNSVIDGLYGNLVDVIAAGAWPRAWRRSAKSSTMGRFSLWRRLQTDWWMALSLRTRSFPK